MVQCREQAVKEPVCNEQSCSEQACRVHVCRACPGTGNKCARNNFSGSTNIFIRTCGYGALDVRTRTTCTRNMRPRNKMAGN
jgi:hypothetical protein